MEYELKHYGVKGMRWGVRKDKKAPNHKSSNTRKKNKKRRNFVDKIKNTPAKVLVKDAAIVMSGSLWVASALIPGAPVLNTLAALTNLTAVGLDD